MGNLGLELFMQSRKGKTDTKVTTLVSYPTGFMPLDFINGQRIEVTDPDTDEVTETYDSVGIVGGTVTMFIADSGLGKTTLAQQMATAIASMYDSSFVIHEDVEQASHMNRVFNISAQTPKWLRNHYTIMQDTHAENIVDRFLDHAKTKLNNRKIFEYDTGLKDLYGEKIKALIPTVCIIDSISVMRSKESSILESDKNLEGLEDTTNNMAGARNAKFNSEMFRQIAPWAKKANILIFVIAHINRKIQTGFLPQPRDIVGLAENESLGAGRTVAYLANSLIRLKNKGQLKLDKDYHINGFVISATFLKSRTNATNVDIDLIFDKATGFSPVLTLVHYGINEGIIKKQGNKYVIPGCEDSPFSKYTFYQEASNNPLLIAKLYDLVLPRMQRYLGTEMDNSNSKVDVDDLLDDLFD